MKTIACFLIGTFFVPFAVGQRLQTRRTVVAKTQLIETGEFHGDEIKAKSGERWWGLFPEKEGLTLKPTTLQVTRVYDPIMDSERSRKWTGKKVSVRSRIEPVFLLKSSRKFRQGRVCTVFRSRKSLGNASTTPLPLADKNYELSVVSDDPNPTDYLGQKSKLILRVGTSQQTIASLEDHNDGGWILLWAGDIDEDDQLDLYMDLSDHYNVSNKILFLSSAADKGKLVKAVAKFSITGC